VGAPGGFRLMGIVNVTPDSFSDGGRFLDPAAAIAHGLELLGEGAEILDVGGESTRPGAEPVDAAEELRRVLPVVEGLAASMLPAHDPHSASPITHRSAVAACPTIAAGPTARPTISIDTAKASVARAALAAGAALVNDVTALRGDPEMAAVVADSGAECCLMHMLGEPRTMQLGPRYGDVVDEVKAFLEQRLAFAVAQGIAEERVLLDPGIGFGKTLVHNLQLLRGLPELAALGRPLVVGTSRKSFLAEAAPAPAAGGRGAERLSAGGRVRGAGPVDVADRLPGTIATCVLAYERGASVLRVHDVAPVRAALAVAAATLGA
jgi:dihydropteroate synthase